MTTAISDIVIEVDGKVTTNKAGVSGGVGGFLDTITDLHFPNQILVLHMFVLAQNSAEPGNLIVPFAPSPPYYSSAFRFPPMSATLTSPKIPLWKDNSFLPATQNIGLDGPPGPVQFTHGVIKPQGPLGPIAQYTTVAQNRKYAAWRGDTTFYAQPTESIASLQNPSNLNPPITFVGYQEYDCFAVINSPPASTEKNPIPSSLTFNIKATYIGNYATEIPSRMSIGISGFIAKSVKTLTMQDDTFLHVLFNDKSEWDDSQVDAGGNKNVLGVSPIASQNGARTTDLTGQLVVDTKKHTFKMPDWF